MSREMGDIYDALMAAKASNEALGAWVRNADARDTVRDRDFAIDRGIAAYERLQRDLRDGHKHVDVPDEKCEHSPTAANLEQADAGHALCETCEGVGVTMIAVYEGGAHRERDAYCPDCNGDGQVEVAA